MLPVQARRLEELLAVEIGADPHFDAVDMLHQYVAGGGAAAGPEPRRQDGAHVGPVGPPADVIVARLEAGPAELEDVAAGPGREEGVAGGGIAEFVHRGGRQPELAQQRLGVGAVILEPVAEGAPADHRIALAAERVLERSIALRHGFEEDDAVAADPVELGPPVAGPGHEARHRPLRAIVLDEDPDLVALGDQAHVETAEIAGLGHAEEAHQSSRSPNSGTCLLSRPCTAAVRSALTRAPAFHSATCRRPSSTVRPRL